MKIKFIIPLLLALFMSSCTFKTSYLQSDAKEYAPTDPAKVKLYGGFPDNLKYEVLGSVSANGVSKEGTITAVKESVAKIGGDALIDMKLDLMRSDGGRLGISGVAVKLK
jgi:hypothetical protein